MKLTEILNRETLSLSFEVFPPKTDLAFDSVEGAIFEIAKLRPSFMSVTYGAGGGTSKYTLNIAKDIKKLLLTGSLDEFLDCLDFAPPGVIDLIKKMSVSLPLGDMSKRMALKNKTGFDCDAALKHVMEEKEDEGQNTILKTAAPERRVKKEESASVERRTAPKYNVVTPKSENTEETAAE